MNISLKCASNALQLRSRLSHRLAEGQAAGEWSHPEIYRRDGDTPQGLKAKASRWLTTAHPPVSLLFRLSDVSQFVKRIRTFMSETLTGPLLQTCVQKADSLTDCRTLSTAASRVVRIQTLVALIYSRRRLNSVLICGRTLI